MAASASEARQNLLRFIGPDEIIGQDSFDILHAPLDDLIVVGTAVLSQQKLENINRHIGAFLYGLRQMFADNFTAKMLTQFFF